MKLYRCYWPDGTITIVLARDKFHAQIILDEEWCDPRPSWLEEVKHFAADFTPRKCLEGPEYIFNGFHGATLEWLDEAIRRPPPKDVHELCCHICGEQGCMVDEEDRVVCEHHTRVAFRRMEEARRQGRGP